MGDVSLGRVSFDAVCLAADPVAAVKGLLNRPLIALEDFLSDQDHGDGVVGFVRSLVTVEAARRFFADEGQKRDASGTMGGTMAVAPGNGPTGAEGMDMAYRGENF